MFALAQLRQPQYNVWALGDGKGWKLVTRVVSHIIIFMPEVKRWKEKNTLMKKMQLHSENGKIDNGCYKNANKVFKVWR